MTQNDFSKPASSFETDNLRTRAEDALEAAREKGEEMYEESEECVRYNPLLAIGVALLSGLIIALVAIPQKKSWRERHIDEPIERSQAGIVAAALAIGALFKQLANSASGTQRRAAKGVRGYSKSAQKAVKRASRKMHL